MIAVILMVAITVVLAAVVYTWASGLADAPGGGPQAGCNQGSGNFLMMAADPPRHTLRDQAEYRMTATNGTVYVAADADDAHRGTSDVADEFNWSWSPTSHDDIEDGDSLSITFNQTGSVSDGDRFDFALRDGHGTLAQCRFTWNR